MDFEQMYGAIAARDTRFDGQFYTAVLTTRIYCRPSCPARKPLPRNVVFYLTAAAAHQAGFRACKRCIPDAVPGTPNWNLRNDVAARAMRLIGDGTVDRAGVEGLASTLGYSSRQLARVLTNELGAGPLALARANRAQTARDLLSQTDMRIADVAFAAGFSSIRQFNDTIAEVFQRTPGQIRADRRTTPGETAGSVSLVLPYREPFDAHGVFAFLRLRTIGGVEAADGEHYVRAVRTPRGVARIELRDEAGGVRLNARLTQLGDLPFVVSRVRRLLDLDADPEAIDAALGVEPRLAESVAAVPGIRLPGVIDPEEMLFRAIIGQQISVAAARLSLTELAACGDPLDGSPDGTGIVRMFPTATQIAEGGYRLVRGPKARIETVRSVAEALASGELTLSLADERAELRQRLLTLRGVGPWTADYVAMRVLGHPDILLVGDSALRLGARRLGLPDRIEDFARPFSPWRSYLGMHLWRAAAAPAHRVM